MNDPAATMHTGPPGSTIHVLHADAGTVAEPDVCEAVEGARFSRTPDERTEAVARIVRRRRQASPRVREEEMQYHADPPEEATFAG